MKKEIRELDKKNGIVQITTYDERWYARPIKHKKSGVPTYEYLPSVTWIASYYPKGIPFYKWLANKGWDEAEAIKQAAGDKGSKVHYAIEDLLKGYPVRMDAKYINPTTGQEEELTLQEYECLMSFAKWFEATKPEIISRELIVFNDQHGYAGMVDFVCMIDGQLYVIDFKTGQYIWPEYKIQISAYQHCNKDWQAAKLAILQLGYKRNKNGYKFTEVQDKFDLFLAAKQIWSNETKNIVPLQKDYPLELKVAFNKKKGQENENHSQKKSR